MSATDLSLIALAGGGVIGWILIRQPIVAVGCVIAADMIGVAMMTPKVRRDPHSETLATYALASVGGALATGAVGMLARCSPTPPTTAWRTAHWRSSSTGNEPRVRKKSPNDTLAW